MNGLVGSARNDTLAGASARTRSGEITLSDVLSAIGDNNKGLWELASYAESLADRLGGSEPNSGRETADRGPESASIVDALHGEARDSLAPTSRIRAALDRINRRLSI